MDFCEPDNSVFLYGDGVAKALVENMANRLSLTSRPDCDDNQNRFDEGSAIKPLALIANVDGSCLARAAKRLHCSYFEISELDDQPSTRFLDWIAKNWVAYSLTTKTAYRMPVAHHICNGLAVHLRIPEHKRETIELALHEAIVNAAVHGNLEINETQNNSMQGFDGFCRISDERLADPQYACRRVEILARWQKGTIELRVVDQGRGFSVKKVKRDGPPWKGLSLIYSLADSVVANKAGNDFTMKFAR